MHTVGSYEAKTHLPQLLERVGGRNHHDHPPRQAGRALVTAVATPSARRRRRHRRDDRVPGAGRPDARRHDLLRDLIDEGRR